MGIEQDSIDLTRVGPGTVMGEFMRQYWIPCMLSSELVADAPPIRLPLMSEKLIAFRETSGKIGILDQRCPHRCASLFLGRNEENGLRCVYHGWKFDAEGNCVDMPSVEEGETLKHKIKAKAYKTAERNGLVWVYMGQNQDAPPPLPSIEPNLLPEEEISYSMVYRECNWLQALEGDIDTSHFGFLHAGSIDPDDLDESHPIYATTVNRKPQYEVADTPWGTSYGAYRQLPQGGVYWRTANYLFPFWTQNPAGKFPNHVHARAWVPIDDDKMMFINVYWKEALNPVNRRGDPKLKDGTVLDKGYKIFNNMMPNGTGWYERWRLIENEGNDWMIDREAQEENVNYTGLMNIHLQDHAITESMGAITDHAFEHLTTADLMIARTRRRVLREARAYAETGAPPPGVADPDVFLKARAGYFVTDEGVAWQDAYAENIKDVIRPAADLVTGK
jgi:phthalate 4,5-dioxygenase